MHANSVIRSRAGGIRYAVLRLHRWLGLAMAVILVIEGLTGSILAFRSSISQWLTPELFGQAPTPQTPRLDLATLAQRAEERIGPNGRVAYFFDDDVGHVVLRVAPRSNPQPDHESGRELGWIVLDPWSGTELGRLAEGQYAHNFAGKVIPFIDELHVSLALGELGIQILGIVALVWTLDCLWSVYLTLPLSRRRFWGRWALAFRIKTPLRIVRGSFDVHRAGGLWFLPMLLIYAWSSVHLTCPDIYDRVTGALVEYQTTDQFVSALPHRGPAPPLLDWHAAQQAADDIIASRARQEGFRVLRRSLFAYFPNEHIYSFSVRTDRPLPGFHDFNIFLDGDRGTLFSVNRPTGSHSGNTVTNWLRALHLASDPLDTGWYRSLIAVTGVLLAAVSISGVYIWWKRRRSRRIARLRNIIEASVT